MEHHSFAIVYACIAVSVQIADSLSASRRSYRTAGEASPQQFRKSFTDWTEKAVDERSQWAVRRLQYKVAQIRVHNNLPTKH